MDVFFALFIVMHLL